jgi:3-dehydroquinate dehydratase-2
MKDKALLILNGPGLADLSAAGDRYGSVTLEQIQNESAALCAELGMSLDCRQTDDQDEMFRWITKDSDHFDALIINPVGSPNAGKVDLGMYDSAIKKIVHLNKPVIEVHLTNIFRQGGERARTLQGPDGEMGFICGLGLHSYLLGIKAVARRLQG